MSEISKNLERLTEDQKKLLKKAGFKLLVKNFLTGVNHGALIFVSNLLLILLNRLYFNSDILLFVFCLITDIYLFHSLRTYSNKNIELFKEQSKKITETNK